MRALVTVMLFAVAGCWVTRSEIDEKIEQFEPTDTGSTGDTGQ